MNFKKSRNRNGFENTIQKDAIHLSNLAIKTYIFENECICLVFQFSDFDTSLAHNMAIVHIPMFEIVGISCTIVRKLRHRFWFSVPFIHNEK